eukprot:EG_transcript_5793
MPAPAEGVAFPADAAGERSTTAFGKAVFGGCVSAVAPDVAKAVERERDWRHRYPAPLLRIAEAALHSPENALTIARTGLGLVHGAFQFVRASSSTLLSAALQEHSTPLYRTAVIKGQKEGPAPPPSMPLGRATLEGEALLKQLQEWADHGTIEPDVVAAVAEVQKNPEWRDLRGRHFVIFGANSEMGPLPHLLAMGATVIAIARKSQKWQRLIDIARQSSGTLTFPVDVEVDDKTPDDILCRAAGCDLLANTPEIHTWLRGVVQPPLTIGMYVYMDGEAHVRATVAADALTHHLAQQLGPQNVSLAYLGSPAVAAAIPTAAAQAQADNRAVAPWWQTPLSWLCGFQSNSRPPVTAADGTQFFVNDGYSVLQGPNYALAKTIQMWRAMVARAEGMVVSSPMAPAAKSDSVMHNPQMATAMDGMHHFKPLYAFEPSTASALMALLLVHDLMNPKAASHPEVPLRNPMELFAQTAVHGGTWRCGYTLDSIGKALFLCGKVAPAPAVPPERDCA